MRQVLVGVAEGDPLVGWIDTDDLARRSDGIHYTKEGSQALGQRFAEKAIELIQSQSKE